MQGGDLFANRLTLGQRVGSTGTLDITASSQPLNAGELLTVGEFGQGLLTVSNLTEIKATNATFADKPGSNFTVTLNGNGTLGSTKLTIEEALVVGSQGSGHLEMNGGASVRAQHTEFANLSGSVTAEINSRSLLQAGDTHIAGGGTATLDIDDGFLNTTFAILADSNSSHATVNLIDGPTGGGPAWTSTGEIIIGGSGTAIVNMFGGDLTAPRLTLAQRAGSHGTLNIFGAAHPVDAGELLTVGEFGQGTLTTSGSPVMKATEAMFGQNAGSSFSATLSGASKMTIAEGIIVGSRGSGSFELKDNASVSAQNTHVADLEGSVVTISMNPVTTWDAGSLSLGAGGTATLTLTDGFLNTTFAILADGAAANATLNMVAGPVSGQPFWTSTEEIIIAGSGTAVVNMQGGDLKAPVLSIAQRTGANGTLAITGSDAKVTGRITVGEFGNGTLSISRGKLMSADATLALHVGSVADVELTNNAAWNNFQGELNVGVEGKARLVTGSGAVIETLNLFSAIQPGSEATIGLNDVGTKLEAFGDVILGGEGKSLVEINDGALLDTRGAQIGSSLSGGAGRSSVALVSGGIWNNPDSPLVLGGLSSNLLQLAARGRVDTQSLTLGQTTGAIANGATRNRLHADDSSIVNVTGLLKVGVNVTSRVEIYGSSRLFSALAEIGNGATDVSGVVQIAVSGRWDNIGVIHVASTTGISELDITDGGVVATRGLDLGSAGNSAQFARVSIRHDGSSLSSTAGAINVGQFGNGILVIDDHGLLLANDVNVYAMGVVTGNGGAIVANFHNLGGTIEPGNSPGILNIQGSFDQSAGGLKLEIAGLAPGSFDVVNVSGPVTLSGGDLQFVFINGFLPQRGDTIEFLNSSTMPQMDFANLMMDYSGAAPGFQFSVMSLASGITFTALNNAQPIPEPGTVLLVAGGILVFPARSRRAWSPN